MAQILSEKGKTLVLNLSGCSGMVTLLDHETEEDLSDLILALRNRTVMHLEPYLNPAGKFDYIACSSNPMDLFECSRKDMEEIKRVVAGCDNYQYIVVLIGDLFSACDVFLTGEAEVFCISDNSLFSQCREKEFATFWRQITDKQYRTVSATELYGTQKGEHLLLEWQHTSLGNTVRNYV